jgi:hypothetical protein
MKINLNSIHKELPFIVVLLALIEAPFIGIFDFPFYLVTFFIIIDILFIIYANYKNTNLNKVHVGIILFLFFLLIYGVLLSSGNTKGIFYHSHVILLFLWINLLDNNKEFNFRAFKIIIGIYVLLSFIIYFFFWSDLIPLFYEKENILALKSNFFKRSYGPLFNPLTHGYLLLISFYFLELYEEKAYIIKSLILIGLIITFVKAAFVSLILYFILITIYYRSYKNFIFIGLVGVLAYIFIPSIQSNVDSIFTLQDKQGSIEVHLEHLNLAVNTFLEHPFGVGFLERFYSLESWIFDYVVIYGILGVLGILLLLVTPIISSLIKKCNQKFIILLCFIPVFTVIPFHYFNVPLTLWFLVFYDK